MNIHEYQAKEILSTYDIPVPRGRVGPDRRPGRAGGQDDGRALRGQGADLRRRSRQGRRRASWCIIRSRPTRWPRSCSASRLVTPQTGPEGLKVRRILVEEAVGIAREFYLSITLDRETSRYCLIASAEGGVDIEEIAAKSPEKIHCSAIDPFTGLRSYQARKIALALGLTGSLCEDCVAADPQPLPRLPRKGLLPGRNQPAGGHQGRLADGDGRQDQLRRQRHVPPPRIPRHASTTRSSTRWKSPPANTTSPTSS